MLSLLQDLRYGIRTLTRTPGFTLIAIAVLAVGIGANVAVFSLANSLFLRPLPVGEPASVVRVYSNLYSNTRYGAYLELRDRNSTLEGLAAFQIQSFGLRVEADIEHAFGTIVSGEYFPLLRVSPAVGRLLTPADDRSGAAPVAVLSHGFWMRRFGGSSDVIGKTIALNDYPFTIVGVAPPGFTGLMVPLVGDLWVPLATDSVLRPAVEPAARLDTMSLHMVGRLKPGVDRSQAQADLDTIGHQLRQARGEPDRNQAVTVYGSTMLHPEISAPITAFTAVLMTLVALVLLIVCVNVANLVLARAAGRESELAIRQSLGAGRGRLVRQLLTESFLLSAAGAAGGVAIALWGIRLFTAINLPTPFPIAFQLPIDGRVLAFTTLAAVAATLMFGMVPALSASRVDLVRAIKGMGGGGPRQSRLRSAFLVAQVALSILLLVASGLFIRSFRRAQSIDRGFDAGGVLTASVDLETRGYTPARGRDFVRMLSERLEGSPGVVAANIVDIVPLTLSNTTTALLRDGDPAPAPGERGPTPIIYVNAVAPGHFKTLRIPMIEGRDFTYADSDPAPRVAIVNETLARRFWPGQRAVGQRLRPIDGGSKTTIEVVGVVRDSKYVTIGEAERPFLYWPLAQEYTPRLTVLLRSGGDAGSALATLKQQVSGLDPGLAVFNVAPLVDVTATSLLPARIAGDLLGTLGLVALVLAALGIYGVLSFLVRARTREIGVRVALGATPSAVTMLVVRQALRWTATGAALGIAAAVLLTQLLKGFLYGISPTDPLTFAVALVLLGVIACIAALVPAWRASRIDPLDALRVL